MIELYYSILNFMNTGAFSVFLIYAIFVWVIMTPRVITGIAYHLKYEKKQNRSYDCNIKHNCTAIVPVFQEPKDDFKRCLSTLKKSLKTGAKEHQIIVIIDGVESKEAGYSSDEYQVAKKYADDIVFTNFRNKRENLASVADMIKHDITLTSDSDTFYEESTVFELLKPFSDKKVGGTTSSQRIYNPSNTLQRIADWLEHARILSSLPSMSLAESVGCLPGRAIAYRSKILKDNKEKFINDFYLGGRSIVGDDRVITNYILQAGYKTIFAARAKVTTLAPDTLWVWIKQQLRWSRSSQKYTIISPWLLKHKTTAAIYWTDIMLTVFTTGIIGHWIYTAMTGSMEHTLIYALFIAFLGMTMTMFVRQIYHLITTPKDMVLLPVFAFYATGLQLIRFYGLLTMHKAAVWGTRANNEETNKKEIKKSSDLIKFQVPEKEFSK